MRYFTVERRINGEIRKIRVQAVSGAQAARLADAWVAEGSK